MTDRRQPRDDGKKPRGNRAKGVEYDVCPKEPGDDTGQPINRILGKRVVEKGIDNHPDGDPADRTQEDERQQTPRTTRILNLAAQHPQVHQVDEGLEQSGPLDQHAGDGLA